MPIVLNDVIKDLNLTEEQKAALGTVQENFDSIYSEAIENEKQGLLTKNNDLITRLKEAKELADKAKGIDADGYNEYLENKDKLEADRIKAEEDALIAKQDWDKLKGDIVNNHQTELQTITQTKDKEIESLRTYLDTELIENVALKEIDAVKGSQVLLMPHVKNNIKTYLDENGRYTTKVVDNAGNDRMNSKTGEPMKVSELIAEFQANEAFAGAFPIQNTGSNTTVNVGGKTFNATNNPYDKSGKAYSITEQAKLQKSNPILAKTLREAVGIVQ